MEYRVAFLSTNIYELREQLTCFIRNKQTVNCWKGKLDTKQISLLASNEDIQEILTKSIGEQKLEKIGELWSQGLSIEWNLLYRNEPKLRRIHLPTYPFVKERYWTKVKVQPESENASRLHPLIHENTSNLSQTRFSSLFTGEEFFLKDHIVQGEKVLPGVTHLEMVRVALEKVCERQRGVSVRLVNIGWIQPIIVKDSGQEVHTRLLSEDEKIRFQIYSESAQGEIIHSQGMVEFPIKTNCNIDIQKIQSEMHKQILDSENCYQTFRDIGIVHGPGYQAIKQIYRGENQALGELSLPLSVKNIQNNYALHPGLMDSALQCMIGLLKPDANFEPQLPFAMESVEILNTCTDKMYSWVRYSSGNDSNRLVKFDIDLCDEQGTVCVKFKGFSSRPLGRNISSPKVGTFLAIPVWKDSEVLIKTSKQYTQHLVLLRGLQKTKFKELEALLPNSQCIKLAGKQQTFESQFILYALRCFEVIQKILKEKPSGEILVQLVIPNTLEESLFIGLLGLLKTASLENPQIVTQIIQANFDENIVNLANKLKDNGNMPYNSNIKYQNNNRKVLTWQELKEVPFPSEIAFKDNGVYLITGGFGGIGIIFAKEILAKTRNAKLILIGRSPLTSEKQAILQQLQTQGEVRYQTVDVTCFNQVLSLIENIQKKYGGLNGIIHSAGIISDNFILKKDAEEFRKVLSPKVAGTINLDKASANLLLDFFALFSSVSGVFGNLGQADYATANSFMDQFAVYRSKKRSGRTLSINWPLWKEGGMTIDSSTEKIMRSMGMIPIETKEAITVFYQGLKSKHSQILVLQGFIPQIRASILEAKNITSVSTSKNIEPIVDSKTLHQKLQQYLIKQFSFILQLDSSQVKPEEFFDRYRMDSILAVKLTRELEKTFGPLPQTLFFEYNNIIELTNHLINSYHSQVVALCAQKMPMNGLKSGVQATWQSTDSLIPKSKKQNSVSKFSELFHLNQIDTGRPIFWIHPVQGSVQPYCCIANEVQRPFYGIQPRGFQTNQEPIYGIQAIAAYYIQIIKSVQPQGPYDLGGYSLGGLISYEIMQQLKVLGELTNSIIMVDTFDVPAMKKIQISKKSLALQVINQLLMTTIPHKSDELMKALIHRDEVKHSLKYNDFCEKLITLAQKKGISTIKRLKEKIQQVSSVTKAYAINHYHPIANVQTNTCKCYYFKNKSKLFYGKLQPYSIISDEEISVDHTNYWQFWATNLKIKIMEVNSSNHITIFSEPQAYNDIINLCKDLYQEDAT